MSLPPSPLPEADDSLLVQQAQAGHARAFEWLIVKYQARIERLIARLVRDRDMVPDLAQETFIRAWRALGGFRGEAQFYTWLYRIAINTAKKHLLEQKKDPILSESLLQLDDNSEETSRPQNEPSTMETPEAELASRQIVEAVNLALEELPEDLRQALVLREMEGMSYEDIAQVMGCPMGTVRSRIFRAREAISRQIKPLLERQQGKRW